MRWKFFIENENGDFSKRKKCGQQKKKTYFFDPIIAQNSNLPFNFFDL